MHIIHVCRDLKLKSRYVSDTFNKPTVHVCLDEEKNGYVARDQLLYAL